jgi:hypothetical protein
MEEVWSDGHLRGDPPSSSEVEPERLAGRPGKTGPGYRVPAAG